MPDYFTVSHISRKDLARIFSKIKVSVEHFYESTPCWEWTGSKVFGYGNMRWGDKVQRVHRIMYAWIYGPIPYRGAKLEIDHLCKNQSCANPVHLELVTSQVNSLRSNNLAARYAPRTHCGNGHEFTEENTLRYGKGARRCRTCKNDTARKNRAADTEKAAERRARAAAAMRKRRDALRNDPDFRGQQRRHKREAYARQKQNPEWIQKERQRLRDLYHRQKSR